LATQYVPGERNSPRQVEVVVDLGAEALEVAGIGGACAGRGVDARAQALQRRRRRIERVPGEVELAAVVRGEAQIAERERVVAAIGECLQAQELAGRLRHLGVVDEQEIA